jgi:hypothetical protein
MPARVDVRRPRPARVDTARAYRHRYADRFTGDPFRIPISVWCSSVYELEATVASTTLTARPRSARMTLRPG